MNNCTQTSETLFYLSESLLRIRHWFNTTATGIANPWTDPKFFCEDVCRLTSYFLEDYIFVSPLFWYSCYLLIVYGALKAFVYLRRDYLCFLGLGRGARPSNVLGWLTNSWYHFLLMIIIRVDVFSKPFLDPMAEPYNGVLFGMAPRLSPRPAIIGMGPMRQETDDCPPAMEWAMDRFRDFAMDDPGRLMIQAGFLTGLPALRRNLPGAPASGTPNSAAEWGGEVAHVRHDGGTTVRLHPADAREVVQLGWGQRDPLAVMHEVWLWRFFFHWVLWTHTPLPHNSVIVYAPRDEEEEAAVNDILAAAVWWANDQPTQ